MSDNESETHEYTAPAITRRETLESLGVSGVGAGMLAGSAFPGEGRGPPDDRGKGGRGGEKPGGGPPEDSNGRGRGPPDRSKQRDMR